LSELLTTEGLLPKRPTGLASPPICKSRGAIVGQTPRRGMATSLGSLTAPSLLLNRPARLIAPREKLSKRCSTRVPVPGCCPEVVAAVASKNISKQAANILPTREARLAIEHRGHRSHGPRCAALLLMRAAPLLLRKGPTHDPIREAGRAVEICSRGRATCARLSATSITFCSGPLRHPIKPVIAIGQCVARNV